MALFFSTQQRLTLLSMNTSHIPYLFSSPYHMHDGGAHTHVCYQRYRIRLFWLWMKLMTKFDTTQITWERNQVATKRWYRQKNMLYSRVRSPAELLLPCAVIQYQRHVSKWDANVPTCISSLFSFTFTFLHSFSLPYDHIILQYPYHNNQERWILQIYPITMTSWPTSSWMACSCGSRQPR